jgi:aryl-alcohol dehydrogenase-like predicted oxidoreductase
MEYTTLGTSGLQVFLPCLGAMMFGHGPDAPTSEPDSRWIIDAYLEAGGNFIDTANTYTGGESEEGDEAIDTRAVMSRPRRSAEGRS